MTVRLGAVIGFRTTPPPCVMRLERSPKRRNRPAAGPVSSWSPATRKAQVREPGRRVAPVRVLCCGRSNVLVLGAAKERRLAAGATGWRARSCYSRCRVALPKSAAPGHPVGFARRQIRTGSAKRELTLRPILPFDSLMCTRAAASLWAPDAAPTRSARAARGRAAMLAGPRTRSRGRQLASRPASA